MVLEKLLSFFGLDKAIIELLEPVFVRLDDLKVIAKENNLARAELNQELRRLDL